MLANSKTSVSVIALLAGLSTSPVWAQGASPGTETVVVTGSRTISNIANSPTPLTTLSASDLSQMTPSSVADALVKMPVFSGSSFPRQAYQNLTILNLRNFGPNRTLVLMAGHRVTPSLQAGTEGIDTQPKT